MQDYAERVAVITGAGRGIALQCAQQGMKIVLAGIGTNADLTAPGVDTELDRVDQSRPERFKNNHTAVTAEDRLRMRETLGKGVTVKEATRVLFEGLKEEKLYIGPKAFAE